MKTEGYRGLYHPSFEHDACGIGAVVDLKGRPSHKTVDDALKIVEKLEHRQAKMPRERPAMALVFCCRFPIGSFSGRTGNWNLSSQAP